MMYGALGQCCCWLAITLLLHSASKVDPLSTQQKIFGSIAVVFFFVFNIFFGASWQGVSWLYPTEINSTQHRIAGMSYGVATNWAINFGVVFITPLGIARLGWQFYTIWTILNGFIMAAVYLFFPETAGRSLEGIDGMFEAHPTVWVFTNKSMTARKPSTSGGSQVSGDDVPTSPTEERAFASSRNASAVELAPLAKLRHRQPVGGITPLGSMTTVHNDTTPAEDGTVPGQPAAAAEQVETGEEAVEEDEDANAIPLYLAPGATVLSGQGSSLGSQISPSVLL